MSLYFYTQQTATCRNSRQITTIRCNSDYTSNTRIVLSNTAECGMLLIDLARRGTYARDGGTVYRRRGRTHTQGASRYGQRVAENWRTRRLQNWPSRQAVENQTRGVAALHRKAFRRKQRSVEAQSRAAKPGSYIAAAVRLFSTSEKVEKSHRGRLPDSSSSPLPKVDLLTN